MTLTTVPQGKPTAKDAAFDIRQMIGSITGHADSRLQHIRIIVRKYGRQAIADELGNDAQAFLTVYTKLKEAVEAAQGIQVEDLP